MFKHDDLFFPEPQHLIFRPTRLLKPPSGGGRPSKKRMVRMAQRALPVVFKDQQW